MLINFVKMHGLGNDFVVIDAIGQTIHLSTEDIQFIANRHLGVGCDQLLLVESADSHDVDFRYRIFNADGSEVEQCGNGARCFARFLKEQGLTQKNTIRVSTNTGNIVLSIKDDNLVQVDMGVPGLQPKDIPFIADQQKPVYALDTSLGQYNIGVVSLGNPHAVLVVDDITSAPVNTLGAELENHERFPNKANIGFMQVIDQSNISLRVFERGVGETQACGTGACAAVVSGVLRGFLANTVMVNLPGGKLDIQWQGIGSSVLMTGPAETVFKGSIIL